MTVKMSRSTPIQPVVRGFVPLATLVERLGRCADLNELLTACLDALDDLFDFDHSMFLLLDETGSSLYTLASHGYEREGVGSEVALGAGIIGMVAAEGKPIRIGNLGRMVTYARAAQMARGEGSDKEIPLPGLASVASQLAAPAVCMDHTVGVLAVESQQLGAFSDEDEKLLTVVAHSVASSIELDRVSGDSIANSTAPPIADSLREITRSEATPASVVKFFPADGSTFVDGEYLIRGVAGRILWRLLSEHQRSGRIEFTNREVRLDPELQMPSFRDNFESRLLLLQRRLDERQTPFTLGKAGRGRFRLRVQTRVQLESSEGD